MNHNNALSNRYFHLIITAVLFFSFSSSLHAQNDSIHFMHKDFQAAMKLAKDQKKLLFVDCYTVWCSPCKAMDRLVFKKDAVAKYFNENFVNLHLDMETSEGKEVLKKYKVGAFPTFLFIDNNGGIVSKFVGYQPDTTFLRLTKDGVSNTNPAMAIIKRFNAGDRSAELIRSYVKQHIDLFEIEEAKKLAKSFLDTLPKKMKTDTANWMFYDDNKYGKVLTSIGSENFDFLVSNWKAFAKTIGKTDVDEKMHRIFFKITSEALTGYYFKSHPYDKNEFNRLKKQIRNTQLKDTSDLLVMMDMADAAGLQDKAKVGELLADHILGFDEKNKRIAYDFWTMCQVIPVVPVPRKDEVCEKIIQSAKDAGLIATAKMFLKKK